MPSGDLLFQAIEEWHSGLPWGRVLDAGTGLHSLRWITSLDTEGWTAVTAETSILSDIGGITPRESDQVASGNWLDESFLQGELYDTVIADYLIGAVDGFAPYTQEQTFKRLKRHMKSGARLYIIGMQPIPDAADAPADVVVNVTRTRDACILMAGHRCYREFPLSWIERTLVDSGFRVVQSKKFTILHSESSLLRQVAVAERKLPFMPCRQLRDGMAAHIAELKAKIADAVSQSEGRKIPLSFDYVVCAELDGSQATL